MSALSNDPFTLARYAGLYKAVQSAGAAGAFSMDAVGTPFLNEQLASGIPMLVSFPLAWLVLRTVKETNYGDEEVVYVDDAKQQQPAAVPHVDSLEKGSMTDRGDVSISSA